MGRSWKRVGEVSVGIVAGRLPVILAALALTFAVGCGGTEDPTAEGQEQDIFGFGESEAPMPEWATAIEGAWVMNENPEKDRAQSDALQVVFKLDATKKIVHATETWRLESQIHEYAFAPSRTLDKYEPMLVWEHESGDYHHAIKFRSATKTVAICWYANKKETHCNSYRRP